MAAMTPLQLIAPALLGGTAFKVVNLQKNRSKGSRQQQNVNNAVQKARLAADERKRKDNLKRLTASQVARFGALGIGANEGSAAAVISGLRTRSEADAQDRARIQTAMSNNDQMQRKQSLLSEKNSAYQNNLDKLLKFGK